MERQRRSQTHPCPRLRRRPRGHHEYIGAGLPQRSRRPWTPSTGCLMDTLGCGPAGAAPEYRNLSPLVEATSPRWRKRRAPSPDLGVTGAPGTSAQPAGSPSWRLATPSGYRTPGAPQDRRHHLVKTLTTLKPLSVPYRVSDDHGPRTADRLEPVHRVGPELTCAAGQVASTVCAD